MDAAILREKADQAQALLGETGLGCWLSFVRESSMRPDPGIELVAGGDVTWDSAFIVAPSSRVALVGRYDADLVHELGVFGEVMTYDEGIRDALVTVLDRLAPESIGLNYSPDDANCDGLTHGMRLRLEDLLEGTPHLDRLTSAAPLVSLLRSRKSAAEIERIRLAVAITEQVIGELGALIRPGVSEAELAGLIHESFARHGVEPAWPAEGCPIVNTGPDSAIGHARPSTAIRIEPGHVVHVDLGVRLDGYCSDLQRDWYVRRPGEDGPPEEVARAFAATRSAIEAAQAALKPGALGHEVDAAARKSLTAAGYPEYMHATGHQLGRAVHDGGALAGPRWARYGATPDQAVQEGSVFTLELGVETSAGYVGLEEDVVVTGSGAADLASPQRELMVV